MAETPAKPARKTKSTAATTKRKKRKSSTSVSKTPASVTTPAKTETPPEKKEKKPLKRQKIAPSYTQEVKDMMYTFGDARKGWPESAELVESIVKRYLIDLLEIAVEQAHNRGVVRINLSDVVLGIRKDEAKLKRLREFIAFKELRKNIAVTESSTQTTTTNELDSLQKTESKSSKKKVFSSAQIGTFDFIKSLKDFNDDDDGSDSDALLTNEYDEFNKERLRIADEMTKSMTKDEYMDYAECRQVSFTHKKKTKFKDWIASDLDVLYPDSLIEVLGYLAWEMVGFITKHSLLVKKEMETNKELNFMGNGNPHGGRGYNIINVKLQASTDFGGPTNQTPILPVHIREAMRRNQPSYHSVVGWGSHTSTHLIKLPIFS